MRKLIALVVAVGVLGYAASRVYDFYSYNVNTPVSTTSDPVVFRVDTGELPSDVADALLANRLIRNRDVFLWYLRLNGSGNKFEAGSFILNRNMSVPLIADALQRATANEIGVTIKEGFPIKFQAPAVEKAGIGKASDYINAAADPVWSNSYDFLNSRPPNADPPLEGYLFPDTYLVDPRAGVRGLIKAQLDRFGNVFSADWRTQIAMPIAGRPAESIESMVILASMVEREANRDPDRGNVCSVYYNRLRAGIPLGVDATLLYALGRLSPEPNFDELKLDSPFNTRTHAGLPPGPISNPGQAAMLACIQPPQTNYLFYFTDRLGTTHFETNESDFNRDIQKYGVSGS